MFTQDCIPCAIRNNLPFWQESNERIYGGLGGRGAVNANHRLTQLSRTPLLNTASEKFDPIPTVSPREGESYQGAGGYIVALSAGKAMFRPNVLRRMKSKRLAGGGGGIRTPETLSSLTVFKTGAFNHSATPPFLILAYSASYACICDNLVFSCPVLGATVTKLSR